MNDYKISVLILTYNSSYDALKNTIDSVLEQKGIDIEIVISDDGSKECCLDKIEEYLICKAFSNYKIIYNKNNVGTVKNFYYGLQNVSNKYVKDISPGDMLYGNYALREWLIYTIDKNAAWSFCDTIYYIRKNKRIIPIQVKTSPQMTKIYKRDNFYKIRWQYFVLGDICVGASMIFKKDVMLRYTEEIIDKVKYAEDNIFRMAMFDGVSFCYFENYCILYEYGTGVSTSKNEKWLNLLKNDYNATNDILNQRYRIDRFQRNMLDAFKVLSGKNKLNKVFVRNYLVYRLYTSFFTKKSIPYLPNSGEVM